MRALLPRTPLLNGALPRELVFDADSWERWAKSGPAGAAPPLWRGLFGSQTIFLFPDDWTNQAVNEYATLWLTKELVEFPLSPPEERALAKRLPALVSSVGNENTTSPDAVQTRSTREDDRG